jgi:phosphatidylserine/phosphatidylglycerophosphate/cardiolipin synthase-like enzyme
MPGSSSEQEIPVEAFSRGDVFGPATDFLGSPFPELGRSGLFPVHDAASTRIAILENGDQAFAARIRSLEAADTSIRIQALIFTGDESGQYIARLLKEKKAGGLDVRVIVDAFSNPSPQTQNLYFDLKQWGIEVEGYEAMLLQWVNELPVPKLVPHTELDQMDKRYHEKLWIIDGETDHGVAITGGLNIANEYFRIDPESPGGNWRDQDVMVRGAMVHDMTHAFDRNFDNFMKIKKSRGPFNTNLYWEATREVLGRTGHIPFHFDSDPRLMARVEELARRQPELRFLPARARFFQNRPRYHETYIEQAYLKLIHAAQQEILIANAYFIPTPRLTAALRAAARRCVTITLLTNSPETNDLPELTMVGRGHYRNLLAVNRELSRCPAAGIHIWEWQGRRPGHPQTEGTMHSKYAVFDRKIALVGSFNLDPRSMRLNSESALVFENRGLATALASIFMERDLLYSRRIGSREAADFDNPRDGAYRFKKSLGELFKNEF